MARLALNDRVSLTREATNPQERMIMSANKSASLYGRVLFPVTVAGAVALCIWLAKRSGLSPCMREQYLSPALAGEWVPGLSVAGEEDPGAAAEMLRD